MEQNQGASLDEVLAINKVIKELTIQGAIETGTQLSKIKKDCGEQKAVRLVFKLLQRLSKRLNIKGGLDDELMIDIADNVVLDYWFLKLEEIAMILDKAGKGGYGKIYDRLDMATIYDWFNQYQNERDSFSEKKNKTLKETHDRNLEQVELEIENIRQAYKDFQNSSFAVKRKLEKGKREQDEEYRKFRQQFFANQTITDSE